MTIDEWNALSTEQAATQLHLCCVAERWIQRMLQDRPYSDVDTLLEKAREYWQQLDEADYLQAFSGHPKIGDLHSLQQKFATSQGTASQEQAGVNDASKMIIKALAQGNADYEKKFGFIFIVYASGKSATEMLQLLRQRLPNDRPTELVIAAAEQARITEGRLRQVFS